MGLKPLEPRQTGSNSPNSALNTSSQNNQTALYNPAQNISQPVAPASINPPAQIGRVQTPPATGISPAANDKALATYGVALDRLHSGKRHGRSVAAYADIPKLEQWWSDYQSRQAVAVNTAERILPPPRNNQNSPQMLVIKRTEPTGVLPNRERNPDGATTLKGSRGKLLQIKV